MRQWWSVPVRISLDGRITINVNSNEQAAELLLADDWPGSDLKARQAILKSMDRPEDADARLAARDAFEDAAREAGVLMEATLSR